MRKTYHICLSSHEEVMYRCDRDFHIGFNSLAEAVFYTDSRLLSDGFMSTHCHAVVQTDRPVALVQKYRYAYTRYFNAQYGRTGRLAEKEAFITEIEGIHRLTAALSYVNRQGLHHGISETPFGYPYCSANIIYRKELGKRLTSSDNLILPERRHRYLVRNTSVPATCRMDADGQLLREDVIDTSYVEQVYITPRNYLFQMNRLSDERSLEEQKKEDSRTPLITLDVIEKGTLGFDVKKMLTNEQGRLNKSMMTDLELCTLIDVYYVPWMKGTTQAPTLYSCTKSEREIIAEMIGRDLAKYRNARFQDKRTLLGRADMCGKMATDTQIRRCLAL